MKVIKAAADWRNFDEGIHCRDAFIKWKYKYVQKIVNSEVPELDTSARAPTLLTSTKKRGNKKMWKKNQRKQALDQGIIRHGEDFHGSTTRKRSPRSPCTEKCNKNCTSLVSET